MARFVEAFKPENGDVLYGLSAPRSEMFNRWLDYRVGLLLAAGDDEDDDDGDDQVRDRPTLEGLLRGQAALSSMDTYNNTFDTFEAITYFKPHTHATRYDDTTFKRGPKNLDDAQRSRITAYATEIQESRFSPQVAPGAAKGKLSAQGYTRKALDKANVPRMAGPNKKPAWYNVRAKLRRNRLRDTEALAYNAAQLATRRACKFGIGLVATNDSFADAKIRFFLDGLQMDNVASKGSVTLPDRLLNADRTYVSITTSELRYVFRNWGMLSAKVRFYVNGNRVQAPWISDWGPLTDVLGTTVRARKPLWDQCAQQRERNGARDKWLF